MIDLSQLAPPAILDALDFETVLAQLQADVIVRQPELANIVVLDSEPINILLQTVAYRELLLRQRINSAAQALLLAYAAGTDLDQIGGNYGIPRLVVTPADTAAIPPVAEVLETDTDFRARILLSLDRFSTAGSSASYEYHARTASAQVQDAKATSPAPGYVTVYVLAYAGDGTADAPLLATVVAALNAAKVRPMTDNVTVLSAAIVTYSVQAHLQVSNGPDAETIRLAALAACQAYVGSARRLAQGASVSGIYKSLHQPGVTRVQLITPTGDIEVAEGQASHCLGVTLTAGDYSV